MVSPGSLFKTPPGVRTSVGKKRALWGPAPSLGALHSALTRVSAALAEQRNLHNRMMAAGVQKRNLRKREQNLFNKTAHLQHAMIWSPSAAVKRNLNKAMKEITEIAPNMRNAERKSAKLIAEYEKARKLYHQLARRVAYLNGTRTLNNSPLSENEKQIIRFTSRMVKNMVSTRRTVRQFPFNRLVSNSIIRSTARR